MGIKETMYSIGILLVLVLLFAGIPFPVQEFAMLDVGQGDSLLFQDGYIQVLIDGGPGSDVVRRLAEEMPWADRTIEVVVATHFDRDHIEGLTHVLSQYHVGMVLLPRYAGQSTNIKEQFIRIVEEKNIPYRFAWYGQTITAGRTVFRVISPIPGPEWERISRSKANNASIILRADMMPDAEAAKTLSFLLTGDAEGAVERQILASVPAKALDVDVLKVGHHGSKTSTSQALIDVVSLGAALVSVGEDNSYGHPTDLVLGRLKGLPIFRTDLDGTVRFAYTGDSWVASCGGKTDLRFWQELCMKNR